MRVSELNFKKGSVGTSLRLKPFVLLFAGVLCVLLGACGPSYPKDRLTETLEAVCLREYGIVIHARLNETRLGVMVEIPGLVEELRKRSAGQDPLKPPVVELEGQVQGQGMEFEFLTTGLFVRIKPPLDREEGAPHEEKSEPMERLRHVSLLVHRAAASTDAELEFYTLIARDPGPDRLDVVFSGHIMDFKRVWLHAISINDLHYYRSDLYARVQPEYLAERTVTAFLQDMEQQSLSQLLGRYAISIEQVSKLLPKVLAAAVDLRGKQPRLLNQPWAVRQISEAQTLVYVPLYPVGDPGALLFTVRFEENRTGLEDIERLESSALPAAYRKWGSTQTWKDQFYVEPMGMPEFLMGQIKKRVLAEFEPIEEDPEQESQVEPPEVSTPEEVTRVLVEKAAYVMYTYEYAELGRVGITHLLDGTRWEIPATDLPLYRRRHPPELIPLP
jgi:hypothetical protein